MLNPKAEILARARKRASLTQGQIATTCGVTQQALHRWESGQVDTITKVEDWARAVGFRIELVPVGGK